MSDEIKAGRLLRYLPAADIKVEVRDAGPPRLQFPASSEAPVDRWFGTEILSHEDGAIRMDRIRAGAVPLLFNHNWADPVGVVDGAAAAGGRLMVDAHLFATERAKEVQAMIEGGLRNVSIGYQLHTLEERGKKGSGEFVARDWEPLEISVVTVPADPSVGIGREKDDAVHAVRVMRTDSTAIPASNVKESIMDQSQSNAAGTPVDIQLGVDHGAQERLRIKTLQMLGRNHNIPADVVDGWVDAGMTGDEAAHRTSRTPRPPSA
jgi:HK97 family phage prohead protease